MNTQPSFRLIALFTFLIQRILYVYAQLCPPFTPNLPVSGPLADTQAITAAVQNLTTLISSIMGTAALTSDDTSFSVDIYSLEDGGSLFTYHYSGANLQNASEGVTSVDSNTIYRIGSISKVFTVYTYLANAGDDTWNQPITKYIPELAEAASSTADESDIDALRWHQVTVGALASQLSGVVRDVQSNLGYTNEELVAFGLPPVPTTNASYCGESQIQFPCDRAGEFVENIDSFSTC